MTVFEGGNIVKHSALYLRRVISALLILMIIATAAMCALSVSAEELDEIADTGAATYYLYGLNTNDPDFGAMNAPTGAFVYDNARGYYYYDVKTFQGGDYCFVVSTVANSGARAVSNAAVSSAAAQGNYYLQGGSYHGYPCMHLWNPSGDAVRLYFSSVSSGLYAVALSSIGNDSPTQQPTQSPTTAPNTPTSAPTQRPTTPSTPSGKKVVYCENAAGWGAVYAYMWNETSPVQENASWPGVKMTNIGGNIWSYELPRDYANVIFNIGSNQTQTGNMVFPGSGYLFNNADNSWSIYDTSPLQVSSFGTDLDAPQYNGVAITLSALATGVGVVSYKFSAKSSTSTALIADYSTANTAVWTPRTAGTYTLTFDFKDSAGNTNQRTLTYVIADGLNSTAPYIKQVTPRPGEIKRSAACNISVSAGGGMTGTKLLFYKYTVTDAAGKIVNTPYYTLKSTYQFTPTALGDYTVTVSVQGSNNDVDERAYTYTSVNNVTTPTTPVVTPTQPPSGGSRKGDADRDNDVTIFDVTCIQRWLADMITASEIDLTAADCDDDPGVTIFDATHIQRFLADMIAEL